MEKRHYCRLCFKETNSFYVIHSKIGIEFRIKKIISQHFWFEINENDPISGKICTPCWRKLKTFHDFYNEINKAQENINSFLEIQSKSHENDCESSIERTKNSNQLKNEHSFVENFSEEEDEDEMFSSCFVSDDGNEGTNPSKINNFDKNSNMDIVIESNVTGLDLQNIEQLGSCVKKEVEITKSHEGDESESFSGKEKNIYINKEQKSISKKHPNIEILKEQKEHNEIDSIDSKEIIKKQIQIERNLKIRKISHKTDLDYEKEQEENIIQSYFKMECEICGQVFISFSSLFDHYSSEHNIRGFITCCGKTYFKRCILAEHVLWHKNPELFKCNTCDKVFSDKRCLNNHLLVHAPPEMKVYKCDECSKSFVQKFRLEKHKLSHLSPEEKKYNCNECEKPYASDALLRAHKRAVHQKSYANMCEICAKVFKSRIFFEKHQLEHLGQNLPRVQCKICNAWMKNEHTMRAHMRLHEDAGRIHECDICGKQGPSRNAVLKHKKFVHLSEKKFKCSLCDKAFKKAIALKEHMTLHTGEVLYSCAFCTKTFNSGANMHTHKKRAHPVEWQNERNKKLLETNLNPVSLIK